jgi:isopentenyl-diphosphate delta-isomerase type 1
MDQLSDDIVVLVDESDRVIGTALKRDIHHSQTPLHRGFSVFLFNQRGETLLQQRALVKQTWPGIWSNSCCGHPMPGETVEAAAERRLKFELGLNDIELTMALPDFRYRAEKDGVVENEICPVLFGFTETEPTLNSDEIEDVSWVGWPEFLESLDDPMSDISPWAIDEARLLAASEKFRVEFARRTSNDAVQ